MEPVGDLGESIPADDGTESGPALAEPGAHPASHRLEKLTQRSLRDRSVRAIRDAIVQGKFRPGEKIPEQDLAEQLGVSRTPIREAIRILEEQGLVETKPKNGTFIARVDRRAARDGLAVRTALEELAIRQAIDRLDPAGWHELCGKLEAVLVEMAAAVGRGDPAAATECDTQWHTMLLEAAGNRYLSRAWRLVGLHLLIWSPERELYPQTPEEWAVGFTERHAELLETLRGRDPDACARAIRSHISRKLLDLEIEGTNEHAGTTGAPTTTETSGRR
jgi:DNA-binding GntR family transcriptional regulator